MATKRGKTIMLRKEQNNELKLEGGRYSVRVFVTKSKKSKKWVSKFTRDLTIKKDGWDYDPCK